MVVWYNLFTVEVGQSGSRANKDGGKRDFGYGELILFLPASSCQAYLSDKRFLNYCLR